MKKTVVILLVICCTHVPALGLSQVPSSHSNRPKSAETAELLTAAHATLASLPSETRIDVLADVVRVASTTRHPRAQEWLEEVDRLAQDVGDPCRRARYQARMIEVISRRNPAAALERLAQVENTCLEPMASAATVVFAAVTKECGGNCIEDVLAAAEHLGRLGAYPFTAMLVLSQQLGSQGPAAARLFFTTVSQYKAAPSLSWRVHRSFISLIDRERKFLRQEAVVDAISAAITRVRDQRDDDAGLQYVSVIEGGATRQHSDRDVVLGQLHGLAKNVDESLAKRVIEVWPEAATRSSAADIRMTAGVAVGGNMPLPRAAELRVEVERLKSGVAELSVDEIKNLPISAATQVALLSARALQLFPKDPAAASRLLSSAAGHLQKLEDRMERVLAAPYLVEAAVKCREPGVAFKTAELQFDDALSLLRELRRKESTLLTQTAVYWPLRDTVMALGSAELAMPGIVGVRDEELKARLLLALAESVSRQTQ